MHQRKEERQKLQLMPLQTGKQDKKGFLFCLPALRFHTAIGFQVPLCPIQMFSSPDLLINSTHIYEALCK